MEQLSTLDQSRYVSAGLLTASATTGVLAHTLVFIHNEWHLEAPKVAIGHVVVLGALWSGLRCTPLFWQNALGMSAAMFVTYLVSLFTSMTIYRTFFHQLRSFPGPPLAKITKLWHAVQCLDGKNHLMFHKMYEDYGEIVRSGPNEISIFRPDAIELLDMPKSKTSKSDWYDVMHPKISAVFARDPAEHHRQRRLWSQAMSIKSIETYLPRLLRQVDSLSDLVARYDSKPLLVNDVMAWFAYDSMGEFVFNSDFGMMKSNKWHPTILQQSRALQMLGSFNEVIWAVRLAFTLVPWLGTIRDWLETEVYCEQQMKNRMKQGGEEKDIASWFIDHYESDKKVSRQYARNVLSGNAMTAIVAGSDTTRPSLIAVWYMLAKYPEHQDKILQELADVEATDTNTLAVLPHMNAVIKESMRLLPASPTVGTRLTPPEGLLVGETFIPGGVRVGAPRYTVQRLPTAFKDPESFIPERWTSQPELVLDARAWAPFGAGRGQCIGKNLALTEIRLTMAALLKRFQVSFAPGFDPTNVEKIKDQVTAQLGDCWLVFDPRTSQDLRPGSRDD